MLTIYEINTGIEPDDRRLGIIFAQPHLRLVRAGDAYRLEAACSTAGRQMIREILGSVTKDSPVHFLAFPEYSMPEDMVPEVDQKVQAEAWPWNRHGPCRPRRAPDSCAIQQSRKCTNDHE